MSDHISAASGAGGNWTWRSPLIRTALRLRHPQTLRELELIRRIEYSAEKIRAVQRTRLECLLRHAWAETDYYRGILADCGVVRDGQARLDRFTDIPFLTKQLERMNERSVKL